MEGCRQYLLMIASALVAPELQAKLGPSDLVQDTFVEAQRHLGAFRGRTRDEMRAWLRRILECRLSNVRRAYQVSAKRAVVREVSLESLGVDSERPGGVVASRLPSPSNHAVGNEWKQLLEQALARLPEHYRDAVTWRHQEQLPWDEIGRRLGCSAEAARKIWSRAIEQLRRELGEVGIVP
jgi:RNA polymerase sigma-70 factor (ECF subfamily)